MEYTYKDYKVIVSKCQGADWRGWWQYVVTGRVSFQGRCRGLLREVKAHLKRKINELDTAKGANAS